MPRLALGMGFVGDAREAATTFLAAGGRHIDGAFEYGNHAAIGEAVRASGVPRSEVFLSTKIPSRMLGATCSVPYHEMLSNCMDSLLSL